MIIDDYFFQKMNYSPNFKYKEQAIMMTGSEKKSYLIEEIVDEMERLKCKFLREKPYLKLKKGRSIWFISHEDRKDQIFMIKNKIDKEQVVTYLVITTSLEIKQQYGGHNQNEEHSLKVLKDCFRHQFGKDIQELREKDARVCLKFDELSESVFAFVLLDSLGIRAKFGKK